MSQDLCDEAEFVRQEEVTKSVLRSQLWLKLELLIRAKQELQTSDRMSGSSVPSSQLAWNRGDVYMDEMSVYISQRMPAATPFQVQAEKLVEMEMVPGFRSGVFDVTGVDGYLRSTWPPETLDRVLVCV
jgi:hypothetical protein